MENSESEYCPDCGYYLPMCNCNTSEGLKNRIKKLTLLLQEQVDLLRDTQLRQISKIEDLKEDIRELKNDIYQATRKD